jgi:hypothetical protein
MNINIPMKLWGGSHWNTLVYMENIVVYREGNLQYENLRDGRLSEPTTLNDGSTVRFHDGLNRLSDLIEAGLLIEVESDSDKGKYALTDYGWAVAGEARRHYASEWPDWDIFQPKAKKRPENKRG